MKKFRCKECNENSYSSASIEHQINPGCPYYGSPNVEEVEYKPDDKDKEVL